ncbi:putative pectinesterase 66 [Senna tora]|uniref:Putative pectinesterase 66 n=1 Tax=Senna tora TaxID=362788 RepID=A0A834WMK0_9FABA|nr:putative pectinesterase 66 [Senna tora]
MDCSNNPPKIIVVDKSKAAGPNIFQSIQSAINSVPTNNIQWFNIKIAPGTYS